MAKSPTHSFGQIIGNVIEKAMHERLNSVAEKNGLYLDYAHPRKVRNSRKRVCWEDQGGIEHALDYVFERGGSEEILGAPVAFIEIAWRRYTKHSRNKASEIECAIIHLLTKYQEHHPFAGVILAGDFTNPSIEQFKSSGFEIVHFSYEEVQKAFRVANIDAFFDEESLDGDVQAKVNQWGSLSESEKVQVSCELCKNNVEKIDNFIGKLDEMLGRRLIRIIVRPLHGDDISVGSTSEAIKEIESYEEGGLQGKFCRYEIRVEYSNGDHVSGAFRCKEDAILFVGKIT